MKCCDEWGEVRTLIADKQSFKGVENYFVDALLDEDTLEASNESAEEGDNNDNEADSKPKPLEEEEEEYKINSIIDFNKINVIDAANEADEWVIN